MRSLPATKEQPPESRGLLPFHRTVVARRNLDASFSEVERAVRICLDQVVKVAFPSAAGRDGFDLVADVHTRGLPRWIRMPVEVEIESPRTRRTGLIAHLRRLPRRYLKLLPVMEADLLARPAPGSSTELVLEGTYHPPVGGLGLIGDLLAGRFVAQSTAEAFIDDLGRQIDVAVAQGCAAMTTGETAGRGA